MLLAWKDRPLGIQTTVRRDFPDVPGGLMQPSERRILLHKRLDFLSFSQQTIVDLQQLRLLHQPRRWHLHQPRQPPPLQLPIVRQGQIAQSVKQLAQRVEQAAVRYVVQRSVQLLVITSM